MASIFPFLHDLELQVRLLIALPLLIVSEFVVHQRMRTVVSPFLDDGLIPDDRRKQFDQAIASATRVRNSVAAELLLIAIVYGLVDSKMPDTQGREELDDGGARKCLI